MISADRFALDGQFAWWIVDSPDDLPSHTFEIEVGCRHCWHWSSVVQGDACCACHVPYTVDDGYAAYLVSIVPGMVLPIVEELPVPHRPVVVRSGGATRLWSTEDVYEHVTLPPAAAPGMWCVQVRLAPSGPNRRNRPKSEGD